MGAIEAYHIESIGAWDVAAGKLIIEEAGGVVIDTAGEYYFFYHLCMIVINSDIFNYFTFSFLQFRLNFTFLYTQK